MLADISCSVLGGRDYDEAVDLLTREFCQHDPVELALQITPEEFRVMLELELEPIWRNELSVVVRHTPSGGLVGAMVAMDALAEPVDSRGRISRKFAPIGEIANHFHNFYIETRSPQPGSCLYLFVVGVRSDFAGQGVGQMLIGEVLRNARRKGYRSAFALTTNLASTKAFKHHRFTTVKTLGYQDYRYENRFVFSGITEHPGLCLMERESLDDYSG
jgi:GNAT superfamily N-acetyltransferase